MGVDGCTPQKQLPSSERILRAGTAHPIPPLSLSLTHVRDHLSASGLVWDHTTTFIVCFRPTAIPSHKPSKLSYKISRFLITNGVGS